ncbi:MAG: hypothetical protein CMH32_06760 [Micavibrio sp.]|nr:hypothetical protein [Micavibrio sp.]
MDETRGAGLLGSEARVKNYGQNLEGFAAAIQNEIVTGQGTGNAFLGGSDSVDAVLASNALSGAMMNEMDAVYCDGSDLQLTWMDSRDADDNFFVKGLGRQAGERIVAGLSGRIDGAQIGVYDGISIQMADGTAQAVPSEVNCGSVAVDIPVGAPVMVFANIAAAAGQVDLAQRYEYRTEECGVDGQGNPQSGSVLYRELKQGNEILDSVLVSSNCSADVTGQTDLALLGEALSHTNLTDGVNFAGSGATGTAIETALENNLSEVECREVEQAPNTDTDNDGINDTYVAPDGATDQSYSTCSEAIALAQTNYDFNEVEAGSEDWNVFTTACGGASGSKNEEINGEVATISYPAYSGEVTYRQKVYVGTLDDGTESETLQRVGKPEAQSINCYRSNMATVSCNAQRPADYGNGNTWTFKSGSGFDVERTETVTDFEDATTTPPRPADPNYGSWAATAVDCVWTEEEVLGDDACPANHVATVDGLRTRDHNVTDLNGNTTPTAWTTITPPTCVPVVNASCNNSVRNGCSAGSANDGAHPDTGSEYRWRCDGSPSGVGSNSPMCAMTIPVDGQCGSADGTAVSSKPTSNLCSEGSASSVSGSGPWTWSCNSTTGGANDSCSAEKSVPPGSCDYGGTIYANGASITGLITTSCGNGEKTHRQRKCCSGTPTMLYYEECGAANSNVSCANPHGTTSAPAPQCSSSDCIAGAGVPGCSVGSVSNASNPNVAGHSCTWKCTSGSTTINCSKTIAADNCFAAGTHVTLADGSMKNIEDIVAGDVVKGMDGSENEVEETLVHSLKDRKLYAFNGEAFFVTAEHPFMTENGWKAIDPVMTESLNADFIAENGMPGVLTVGDVLVKENGDKVKLESIESRDRYPHEMPVYNLRVDGNSTYYADGYLVHNK